MPGPLQGEGNEWEKWSPGGTERGSEVGTQSEEEAGDEGTEQTAQEPWMGAGVGGSRSRGAGV